MTAYEAKVENQDALREASVDRAVFTLSPLGADVVIHKLEEWARALT